MLAIWSQNAEVVFGISFLAENWKTDIVLRTVLSENCGQKNWVQFFGRTVRKLDVEILGLISM